MNYNSFEGYCEGIEKAIKQGRIKLATDLTVELNQWMEDNKEL